jgi:hypothetical protein
MTVLERKLLLATVLSVLLMLGAVFAFAHEPVAPNDLVLNGNPLATSRQCAGYDGNRWRWLDTCGGPTAPNTCHMHQCANELCFDPIPCPSGYFQTGNDKNGDAICASIVASIPTATPTPMPTMTPEGALGVVQSGVLAPDASCVSNLDGKITCTQAGFTANFVGIGPDPGTQFDAFGGGNTIDTVRKARGTQGSPTTLVNGDLIYSKQIHGYDGSAYNRSAQMQVRVDGTVSGSTVPMRYEWYTSLTTAASLLRAFVIRASGNVELPLLAAGCYQLGLGSSSEVVCKATPTPTATITPTATVTLTPTPSPTSTTLGTADFLTLTDRCSMLPGSRRFALGSGLAGLDAGFCGGDYTVSCTLADASSIGCMGTSAQEFNGNKTFDDNVIVEGNVYVAPTSTPTPTETAATPTPTATASATPTATETGVPTPTVAQTPAATATAQPAPRVVVGGRPMNGTCWAEGGNMSAWGVFPGSAAGISGNWNGVAGVYVAPRPFDVVINNLSCVRHSVLIFGRVVYARFQTAPGNSCRTNQPTNTNSTCDWTERRDGPYCSMVGDSNSTLRCSRADDIGVTSYSNTPLYVPSNTAYRLMVADNPSSGAASGQCQWFVCMAAGPPDPMN